MGATFPLQAIPKKEQKVSRKRRKKNGEQSGVEMPKRPKGRPLGAQTLQKALEQMIRKGETNALLAAAKKADVIKKVSHKVPTTSSSIDHFASTINDLPTSGIIDPPTVDPSIATARDEGAVTSGVSIQNGCNLETKEGPLAARKRRVNKEQGDAPQIPKRRGRPTKEAKRLREAAGLNQSDVVMGETSVNGAVIIGDHASSDARQPQVPPQSQLPTNSGSSMEIALQGQQLQRNASHHQNHNSSIRSSSRPLPMIAKVRLAPPSPLPSRQQEWIYIKERKEQSCSTIATARGDTATTAETVEAGGTQLTSSTSAIIAQGGQQQSPIRPPYTIVAGESQSPMQPRSSNSSVISRAVLLQPGELQMQPPPSVRPQVVALTPASSGSEEAAFASALGAHARTSGTSGGAPISIAELAAAAQRRVLQRAPIDNVHLQAQIVQIQHQQLLSRPPPPTPAEQLHPILRAPNGVQESSSVQRHQVPQQRLPSRLPPRYAEQLSPIMRVPTDDGAGSLAAQANAPGSSGAFPIDNVQLQAQFVQLQAQNEQMQQQMQKMQQMLQQVLHAGVANGAGPLGAQQSEGHVAHSA
ncbi:hypothetical protein PRIPAC_96719 [Pristionchus pacificus]|nr:hypothetical protein PRIPAC_96719 [Pristionchus pacificus]